MSLSIRDLHQVNEMLTFTKFITVKCGRKKMLYNVLSILPTHNCPGGVYLTFDSSWAKMKKPNAILKYCILFCCLFVRFWTVFIKNWIFLMSGESSLIELSPCQIRLSKLVLFFSIQLLLNSPLSDVLTVVYLVDFYIGNTIIFIEIGKVICYVNNKLFQVVFVCFGFDFLLPWMLLFHEIMMFNFQVHLMVRLPIPARLACTSRKYLNRFSERVTPKITSITWSLLRPNMRRHNKTKTPLMHGK